MPAIADTEPNKGDQVMTKKNPTEDMAGYVFATAVLLWPLVFILSLGEGFAVMLGAGSAHTYWPNILPALGYWSSVFMVFGLHTVKTLITMNLKPKI